MLTGSIKISELDALSTIASADFFPIVQSGSLTTFRASITTLEAWLSVSGSVISASWASASLTSVQSISASWASASLTSVQSISASFSSASISSSFSGVAISASYAPFSQAFQASASWSSASLSSSYALTASYSVSGLSASYAFSASYAPALADTIPIGTIIPFGSSTVPQNWLECNGDAKSTASFADLYSAIQTTDPAASFGYLCDGFGNRNSAGTFFKLPDLRGEFARGWDHNRGVDLGRTFGSIQTSSLGGHYHGIGEWNSPTNDDMYFITRDWSGITTYIERYIEGQSGSPKTRPVTNPTTGQSAATTGPINGVGDVYPRNISIMFCIKYTNSVNFASSGLSLAGDVIGNTSTTNVVAIQTVPVTSVVPTDGQVLQYSSAAGKWVPSALVSSGGPKFIPSSSIILSFNNSGIPFTTFDLSSSIPPTSTAAILTYLISTGQGPVHISLRANASSSVNVVSVGATGGGDVAYIQSQVIVPTSGSKLDIGINAGGNGNIIISGYF